MQKTTANKVAETPIFAPTESVAITSQNSEPKTASQFPPKSLHDRFEKVEIFNSKKGFYDEFSARLKGVESFREKHDGSGLVLTILNQSTEEKIEFSNQNLILDYLNNAIEQGKKIKEKVEMEILNLEI